MPNKNKKTGFYFYAKEYSDKEHIPIKDAIEKTYMSWKSLTPAEQAPYERMAVDHRAKMREEREAEIQANAIKPDTEYDFERVINQKKEDIVAKLKGKLGSISDIKKQSWYFIKFQSFCKTEEDDYYVLAEVGLVEYSLEKGITKQYHAFIKPEVIPPGYAGACLASSRDYHQIPLKSFNKATDDYAQIYMDIVNFIEPDTDINNNYNPLFCLNDDYNEVKFGIDWLHERSVRKYSNPPRIDKIIDLQSLVIGLADTRRQELSYTSATDLLTSYTFDYSPNTRCTYHEDLGVNYCALGYVKRFAYLISDQLCPIFGVETIPGSHLPIEKVTGVPVQFERSSNIKEARLNDRKKFNNAPYDPEEGRRDIRTFSSTASTVFKSASNKQFSVVTSSAMSDIGDSVSVISQPSSRVKVADKFTRIPPASTTTNKQPETANKKFSYANMASRATTTTRTEYRPQFSIRDENEYSDTDDDSKWSVVNKH